MRGRKPKATTLRVLQGNAGKRALNPDEPQPETLATACPVEIDDPAARAEWERAIVPAIERGQVTADDRVMAIAYCELWATYRSQLADAAKHAHVVAVGKHKYPTPNPARVMANKTLLILKGVVAELGFSPTARTRVKATKRPSVDAMKEKYFGASRRRA
jgi:P27 family predicted phage terminase small subunit